MGIRPSLKLIFALTDFKENDERWELTDEEMEDIWTEDPVLTLDNLNGYDCEKSELWYLKAFITQRQEPLKITDAVIFPDSEYGVKGIMGIVIDEVEYNNLCLWALADCFPQFKKSTFVEYPKMDQEDIDRELFFMRMRDEKEEKYDVLPGPFALKYNFMYKGFHDKTLFYWREARFLLNHVLKMKTTPEMYKLGLYFKWG